MSRVGRTDTEPELVLRRALHSLGFRFRLHVPDLPGRPDIVLPRYRVIFFVNGCFWHGHSCPRGRCPSSNRLFWETKIRTNRERDERTARRLRAHGWKVLTIWECRLRKWTTATLRQRLSILLVRDEEPHDALLERS
jgi:DNA mismatch endonuclease (patch repair protein)